MANYKKAVVTGGAGFIGSHIVDALIKRRIKVYVIDNLSGGLKSNLNPNARLYKLSVNSPEAAKLIKRLKPDVVFHLAAQIDVRVSVANPTEDAETNILGTLAMAHAASQAKVKKFIFTSSGGAVFGDDVPLPCSETTPANPISPYGIAKRAGEMYVAYVQQMYGTPTVCLRLANAYGPRQGLRGEAGVISLFARRMAKGEQVIIYGDGKNTRDYVYISDIVDAHILAMEKEVTGMFHIGTAREETVNTVFRLLNKAIGGKMKEIHGPERKGEVRRSALDYRKARKVLGWKPKVTFEEGLKRTAQWFLKQST